MTTLEAITMSVDDIRVLTTEQQLDIMYLRDKYLHDLSAVGGKSAYDVAVENGFTGTVLEWLESLKSTSATTVTLTEVVGVAVKLAIDKPKVLCVKASSSQFDLVLCDKTATLSTIKTDIGLAIDNKRIELEIK